MALPAAAILIWPSRVLNTPVGMLVGWSLPACGGTSRSLSQRDAWKSSMKIWACRSEVATSWPLPDCSRSSRATRMPSAQNMPADRSAIGMPARMGPRPGSPVIDIRPPRPCATWSKPGPVRVGPVLAKAGNAGVDEPRIDLAQRRVVDAETLLHVGPVVLDHHIGLGGEPAKNLDALRRLQVEPDGALVAVQVLEIRPMAGAAQPFARPPCARAARP